MKQVGNFSTETISLFPLWNRCARRACGGSRARPSRWHPFHPCPAGRRLPAIPQTQLSSVSGVTAWVRYGRDEGAHDAAEVVVKLKFRRGWNGKSRYGPAAVASGRKGRRLNVLLGLSLNDRTILKDCRLSKTIIFRVILLDKT